MPPKSKKPTKRISRNRPSARKQVPQSIPATLESEAVPHEIKGQGTWVHYLLGFAALLFGVGFYRDSKVLAGIGLLVLAGYLLRKIFRFAIQESLSQPELPPALEPSPTPSEIGQRGKAPIVLAPTQVKPGRFRLTLWGSVSFGLVVLGLLCGILGQLNLENEGIRDSIGLAWFSAGILLLIAGLWNWKKDGLAKLRVSPSVEWTIFGLIMALAAFLRIYKLDVLPSGVFIDMGFQGLTGLQVVYEHKFPFVLNVGPSYAASPVTIYLGALWFLFFPNTQFSLNLMYSLVCLASFPLIYWTFRQLAGPRMALLSLYILAVMRWNINFARNSFPPTLLPFFMFGCLGFLLYGLRVRKLWPFLLSATFSAVGLYAYQTHVVFPLAVLILMVYETLTNWKQVGPNFKRIIAFWALFTVLSWPIYGPMFRGQRTNRQAELSIFTRCQQAGSYQPMFQNWKYTALMFNRRGDPNSRHNLQDHRQLDDVTGMLFFMGFFYALSRFWRRKYFWGLTGAVVMAIPCLITIDAAHSSRMQGMTPFVAFLAATLLVSVWGRLREWAGSWGDWIWVALAAFPLLMMTQQNYKLYFDEQFHSFGCWGEYSTAESMVGREAAKWGAQGYDCFISPRYWTHFTVDYFTYMVRNRVFRLNLPDVLASRPSQPGGGLWYGLEQGRLGVLASLQWLYPGGEAEITQDPHAGPYVSYFKVSPVEVGKTLGLRGIYSNQPGKVLQAVDFPEGLPPGPYHAVFEGCWWVSRSGEYRFLDPKYGRLRWVVAGQAIVPGQVLNIPTGYYHVRLDWDAPSQASSVPLEIECDGAKFRLDASQFTSLPANHGLLGRYYDQMGMNGKPVLTQWDGVLNFVNGNDYPVSSQYLSVRWTGTLHCPQTGTYQFASDGSTGGVELRLDGRQVLDQSGAARSTFLTKGDHPVEVNFNKPLGWSATLGVDWKLPGSNAMVNIPMEYFGETHL